MKTKIITLLLCSTLLYGCNGKCDGYAPKRIKISWSDYNSVKTVLYYFQYWKSAEMHMNDTVRICGYIIGNGDSNYYRTLYEHPKPGDILYMTDDPNDNFRLPRGGKFSLPIRCNIEKMEWLKDYKAGEKIYVKGFCYAKSPADDGGCSWIVIMYPISFSKGKE